MPTALELELLERAARITQAERQATDPLRLWHPIVKAQPFIDSVLHPEVSGLWENWYVGANRSSKTSTGAYCGSMLARYGLEPIHPAYSTLPDGTQLEVKDKATAGWVLGLDSNTNRDIIQPRYFDNGYLKPGMPTPFIPAREVLRWENEAQILKLRNGSFIGWKSSEADAIKVTGGAIDWLHGDEPPKEAHYNELLIRIGAGRRFRKFFTATILPPQGHVESISWVYQKILAPILQGKITDIGLFQASIYDNPHLDRDEIAILESRYPPGSLSRRIRLNGEIVPGIAGAVAYGNFHRAIHVRAQPALSPYRPLVWCWDFNIAPFCTIVGQREPDIFRVYAELVIDEGGIDDMVDEFLKRYPAHPQEVWIYGDATGGNRSHQTSRSSYDLLLSRMQTYSSRVRMKVPEANPLEVDRVNSMNAALRDSTGATHLIIAPACEQLITDFEQVLADPRGGIKKTYNRADLYSQLTHLSDACGYWIHREMPVKLSRPGEMRAPQVPGPGYGRSRVSVPSMGYGGRG